jgi:hypothetical protein
VRAVHDVNAAVAASSSWVSPHRSRRDRSERPRGDGHCHYPYCRGVAGYTVWTPLSPERRPTSGPCSVLPRPGRDRKGALLKFPGGYMAEVPDHPFA